DWTRHLAASGTVAYWVNAKEGQGIDPLRRAIMLTGKGMNEKRVAKGLLPRPVRACILGFPNVGKSALINRLVGRARMKSENRAGVTRQFTWGQVGGQKSKPSPELQITPWMHKTSFPRLPDLLLLDTPGIIPAKQVGQRSAYMLAVCDDIGAAAYDTRAVALTLIEELRTAKTGYRYGHGLEEQSPEEFLERVAGERCGGDLIRAETMVLRDFRDGRLGLVGLEAKLAAASAAADAVAVLAVAAPVGVADVPA
ncbi:P-loop containing nucleoside triphosphate hydrolase protein, partial [Pavlovales sp. CCMP2436]